MPNWFIIVNEIFTLLASLVIILGGIPAVWKFFKWLEVDEQHKRLAIRIMYSDHYLPSRRKKNDNGSATIS